MTQAKADQKKIRTGISTKLLRVLAPLFALSIILLTVFTAFRATGIIGDNAQKSLGQEGRANAADVGRTISTLTDSFEVVADSAERISFPDDAALVKYLEPYLSFSPMAPNGIYIGLENGTWLDPSGWTPDADYVVTERDWYKEGIGSDHFVFGTPYVDENTGDMVVTMSRKVTLNGTRVGVAAVDLTLSGVMDEVSRFTPMGKGVSMLLDGDNILSYYRSEFNGTKVSEHPEDRFLNAVASYAGSTGEGIYQAENDGTSYYVSLNQVPGTGWMLISSVSKGDVLGEMNAFLIAVIIAAILIIILIAVILYLMMKKIVTDPIKRLTDNIEHIAAGDFTIEIDGSGGDEIGRMNGCMRDFVNSMRNTLRDMREVTEKLSHEAHNGRSASEQLNRQAGEQSSSMDQIHAAMEGVAQSVTELAGNATDLAQAVGELSQEGSATGSTMEELIRKARQGQQDMANVQENMDRISGSMSEMNGVVSSVDQAAQEINSIVEMINAISSQTNLLSLNASIEAARAGEAGKGFSVVANEIGKLAEESSKATTDISDIIRDITAQIDNLSKKSEENMEAIAASNEAVSITGKTFEDIFSSLGQAEQTVKDMLKKMDEVNEIATSVAAIAEEQSASTEEVTATVDTAAASAQNVASESRDVDSSAETVADSAARIGGFVGSFRI